MNKTALYCGLSFLGGVACGAAGYWYYSEHESEIKAKFSRTKVIVPAEHSDTLPPPDIAKNIPDELVDGDDTIYFTKTLIEPEEPGIDDDDWYEGCELPGVDEELDPYDEWDYANGYVDPVVEQILDEDEPTDWAYRFPDVEDADIEAHGWEPFVVSFSQADMLVNDMGIAGMVVCHYYPGNDFVVVTDVDEEVETEYGIPIEKLLGDDFWKDTSNYNHDDRCYIYNGELDLVFAIGASFGNDDEFLDLEWDFV